MKTKRDAGMNVGVASLVLIFAALCLTVFAVLSLVTANADLRLSQKTAQAVEDYYRADGACVERVGQIEDAIGDPDGALPDGVQLIERGNDIYYSFSERIDDRQTLEVLLKRSGGALEVVAWKAVTEEMGIDDSIDVWDGETKGASDNG